MNIALQEEPLLVSNLREVDVEHMNIPADFFE
jgi:type III secretion system FlhB-like substrate exporter